MYVLYVLNALKRPQIERLLSQVCATAPAHISHVLADKERCEKSVTYDTTPLGRVAGESGPKRVEFAKELRVFPAGKPGLSALDFAWHFHQQANGAVSLSAQSIWIDEYILLLENECYLAHDISESGDGLVFDLLNCIKLNKENLFAFWADKEQTGPEGGYIIREYGWWRTM
jgi:hypothetical protein